MARPATTFIPIYSVTSKKQRTHFFQTKSNNPLKCGPNQLQPVRILSFGRVSCTGNRHPIPGDRAPKPTPKANPNPTLTLT